jgi:hypothetical protein
MATKDTAHFKLKADNDGGYKAYPSPATRELFQSHFSKGKKDIYFVRVSEKKHRSNRQNQFYWGHCLRLVAEHVDQMDNFVYQRKNGSFDYEPLHRYLTLKWAMENTRDDIIETVKVYVKGQVVDDTIVSMAFDKMSHADTTSYMTWLETKFTLKTGAGFETMMRAEKENAQ